MAISLLFDYLEITFPPKIVCFPHHCHKYAIVLTPVVYNPQESFVFIDSLGWHSTPVPSKAMCKIVKEEDDRTVANEFITIPFLGVPNSDVSSTLLTRESLTM